MLQGGRKKQAIDLRASVQDGGMFAELVPVNLARVGTARLCFLAQNTFVGVAELELDGGIVTVQLTGTEAAEECDREMCGADDCCGDVAFGVQVVGRPMRGGRRSFVALNKGLGDYAAFEGRGIAFQTEAVPTGTERALLMAEHFSSLPVASVRDAVLCEGRLTLECGEMAGEWEGGEEAAGDAAPTAQARSGAESGARAGAGAGAGAGAEAGLAMSIEALAVPSRRSRMSLEELVSRGGTVLAAGEDLEDDEW